MRDEISRPGSGASVVMAFLDLAMYLSKLRLGWRECRYFFAVGYALKMMELTPASPAA